MMRHLLLALAAATATLLGLMPILLGAGAGSEVMSRLAAPMVGGVLTDILFTLLVLPVVYLLVRQRSGGAAGAGQ